MAVKDNINTLRPRQNGCHFADNTFKYIFLNENVTISAKISLKFVPKGPINDITTLDQIMAWRRPGDKPLSEPMMVRLPTHICVTRPQWVKCHNNNYHLVVVVIVLVFFFIREHSNTMYRAWVQKIKGKVFRYILSAVTKKPWAHRADNHKKNIQTDLRNMTFGYQIIIFINLNPSIAYHLAWYISKIVLIVTFF